MIEPSTYCKVSGMAMRCISKLNDDGFPLPLVIEIGCADGQGTMRYAGFTRRVICIDPMVAGRPDIVSLKHETYTPDNKKVEALERRVKDFNCMLVMGCSMWPETVSTVKDLLDSEKVDILIVDGCHHPFEAVWGDFELYYPFVRKGGYVIFDDLYEDCIMQAYDLAKSKHGMVELSRWGIKNDQILQDTGALQKTEE